MDELERILSLSVYNFVPIRWNYIVKFVRELVKKQMSIE